MPEGSRAGIHIRKHVAARFDERKYMTKTVLGLFGDSKMAGEAAGDLKAKGYADEISILARDSNRTEPEKYEIKKDIGAGVGTGAVTGAVTGALAAVFSGITSVIVPGLGFLVGGPLIAALGVTGGAVGALGGGLLGALVDWGIQEPTAKLYEQRIMKGSVLIGVSTDDNTTDEVQSMLAARGAEEISIVG